MDEITKGWINELSSKYPQCAIVISHQFLDGSNRHECGFVPNDFNGALLYFELNKQQFLPTVAKKIQS